jgi:hypothetical protein
LSLELASPSHTLAGRPDFSGSWEINYRLSDNWQQQLEQKIAKIRRDAELRARQSGRGRERQMGQVNLGQQRRNSTNIIDLARFTDTITRASTMTIVQNDTEITIKREGEADLACQLGNNAIYSNNEFGSEVCVWDRSRLIFKILLNQGTLIYHRFLVSDDRKSINLQTRVSHQGSHSFALVQTFQRYQNNSKHYHCQQTLSRGKVCSLRPRDKPKES